MQIPKGKFYQRGQAFLIVVLVMVVALTVGLSIASQTLTNVRLTSEEVTSQRAFSAAEAGVEQLLQRYGSQTNQNQSISNVMLDSNTNTQIANATITPENFSTVSTNTYQLILNNGAPIAQDDGYDIWLTPYNSDPSQLYQSPWTGTLSLYWGDPSANTCSATPSQNTMAAVEVIVVYNNRTDPQVARYAYDPCSSRVTANNFTSISQTNPPAVLGKSFFYVTSPTITITNGLIVRVIPLYAGAVIGVQAQSTQTLPAQGQLVVANGSSGASSQISRQITYFQAWSAPPSEYYNALFVR